MAKDEVLVRAAIKRGAFHLLLEASLYHGVAFVENQLELMQQDDDVVMTDRAQAEVRRKLGNIGRGIAAAERQARDVANLEVGRPSGGRSLRKD